MAPNLTIPSSALITGETSRAEAAEALRPTVNSPLGDPLGRTQVLGTSTIAAPSLRQFISVTDAPWNAKGDAQAVTGSITVGSNQLSGTGITAADQGKPLMVIGAGPNIAQGGSGPTVPGPLNAFIGTVTGGVVSLVTTSGGATPANATFTVSNASVRYGTDDTAAWNAAMVAASNLAAKTGTPTYLLAPSGYAFLLGATVPKNNVAIWAYGATFYMNLSQVTRRPMFNSYFTPISGFSIRGATFVGGYVEQDDQQVFGTSVANPSSTVSSDLAFIDTNVTNWSTGIYYMANVVRGRAIGNTMKNVCADNGYNAINFSTGNLTSGDGAREIIATHNIIEGCATEGVTLVNNSASPSTTNTVNVRCIFAHNIVECNLGHGVPITLEYSLGQVGRQSKFIIANNTATYTGPASSNSTGLNVNDTSAASPVQPSGTSGNPDPEFLNRVVVAGNIVESSCWGLSVGCSEATVSGNVVNVTGNGSLAFRAGKFNNGIMTFTADTASNTTLSNVTSANTNIVNGNSISGPGIQPGTFIVSGAGTATYTISAPATATATAQAMTAYAQDKNMVVVNNVFHMASTAMSNYSMDIEGLRNSTISGNRLSIDPGSTTAQYGFRLLHCGWLDINNNTIEYASGNGIVLDACNDWTLRANRITNCSEASAGWSGFIFQNLTAGAVARCEGNVVVDDRSTHRMAYGFNTGSAGIVELINNEIHGYTTAPTTGTYKMGRGNITDTSTSDLTVIPASGTYSVPPGATLLRVTMWGGGGGGGGGGSAGGASPVANQVGGSGGASGMFTTVLIPVPAGTTSFSVTIGPGGSSGAGAPAGTAGAGNAGSAGGAGFSTVITVGATTYTVQGGGPGIGGGANSTALVIARAWGANGGGTGATVSNGVAGTGGTATSTSGSGGGDGVGPVGGGGAGGCPSSTTAGGLGGAAGKIGASTPGVTAQGNNIGTPNGGNGINAANNTGAGGGGGGGGAWNAGTSGTGGAGGTGGSGSMWVEVLT